MHLSVANTSTFPGNPLWFHCLHGDVIKWKHFSRYWPFVQGIHLHCLISYLPGLYHLHLKLHSGLASRAFMFYFILWAPGHCVIYHRKIYFELRIRKFKFRNIWGVTICPLDSITAANATDRLRHTQAWCMTIVDTFPTEYKDLFIFHSQYHECRWHGSAVIHFVISVSWNDSENTNIYLCFQNESSTTRNVNFMSVLYIHYFNRLHL